MKAYNKNKKKSQKIKKSIQVQKNIRDGRISLRKNYVYLKKFGIFLKKKNKFKMYKFLKQKTEYVIKSHNDPPTDSDLFIALL